MSLALLVFIALLGIGVSNRSPVHPGAASLLFSTEVENLECRESAGPSSVLDATKPSRTKNFSLSGSYECHRPVFSESERDSFIDRVLEAEIPHAKTVAAGLQQTYTATTPLAVEVRGDADVALLNRVAIIYRAELLTALGPSRVSHAVADEETQNPVLVVELRRVDVPQLMSRARLRLPNPKGAPFWRDI